MMKLINSQHHLMLLYLLHDKCVKLLKEPEIN